MLIIAIMILLPPGLGSGVSSLWTTLASIALFIRALRDGYARGVSPRAREVFPESRG